MQHIQFVKDKIPFTQVANGVLQNPELSAKAKGLYAYLYSKPDGWDFAVDRIAKEMSDGRLSINSGLQELEKFGFLTRNRQADGRVTYIVHFPPIEPHVENQHLGEEATCRKPQSAKTHMSKTVIVSNKEYNNKDKEVIKTSEQGSREIPLLIKSFEELNPASKRFYGNTTQREACQNLIDSYTFDRVKKVIEQTLPRTNKLQFFPVITTPVQLRDKWASLESAIQKYQSEKSADKEKYKVAFRG